MHGELNNDSWPYLKEPLESMLFQEISRQFFLSDVISKKSVFKVLLNFIICVLLYFNV